MLPAVAYINISSQWSWENGDFLKRKLNTWDAKINKNGHLGEFIGHDDDDDDNGAASAWV